MKQTYYGAFDGFSKAERQGAGAWQTLKGLYPDSSEQLDALSEIEIGSADYLDVLLPTLA
ncbi:MAG: hypothetical protein VB996_11065 [Pseudomonadales bacterium]